MSDLLTEINGDLMVELKVDGTLIVTTCDGECQSCFKCPPTKEGIAEVESLVANLNWWLDHVRSR